ncbi:type IV pilin [Natronorubrum sp. FCH18a]|uniref:type IV pilin n=1 Tax=Natronorubrum sp. FCH18a TaxID=3447018 RepID=UPI003F5115AF
MDLTKYRQKLIGSEEERAVSPVIGVILMVAITVILAAVIAAFVLDLGDDMGSGSVNAGVNSDVSNSDGEVTLSVDTMGDAEYFRLGGDVVSGDEANLDGDLDATGDTVTLTLADGTGSISPNPSSGVQALNEQEGEANIVAVDGDSESVIGSFEWDFDDDVYA